MTRIAVSVVIIASALLIEWAAPSVRAAPVAKFQEPGTCVEFATVGTFKISHCIDPNGNEFEASTSGMLISVGN